MNEGSILQFYLGGSISSMWLYFHSDTPGDDSLKFNFPFNAARIHHFEHSYASFEAGRQVQDSTYNDSITYLQSMAGVRAKIEMPYLNDLKALGPLVVNRAELVIPVQDLTTEVYSPPSKLNLVAILADGSSEALLDYTNESLYFGGTYDAVNKLYKFNISRHLQSILDGKPYRLWIIRYGSLYCGFQRLCQHSAQPCNSHYREECVKTGSPEFVLYHSGLISYLID
jgi:hypothetical protein